MKMKRNCFYLLRVAITLSAFVTGVYLLSWLAAQTKHMQRTRRETVGNQVQGEPQSNPEPKPPPESSAQGLASLGEGRETGPHDADSLTTPGALARRPGESFASFSARWRGLVPAACRAIDASSTTYKTAVRDLTTSPGVLAVCVPKKGGYTSWKNVFGQLSRWNLPRRPPVSVITARHPLGRLVSGYSDKFLGGAPIAEYNGAWRLASGSRESWSARWRFYWLPCLIARGSLVLPKHCLPKLEGPYRSNAERQQISRCLELNHQSAKETHRDAAFTFSDYIQFVLWSHDLGVMNVHFAPITSLCAPCSRTYDYIVHTETLSQDVKELFEILDVPAAIQMKQKHVSLNASRGSSDELFDSISAESMARILNIYMPDFVLFGYTF